MRKIRKILIIDEKTSSASAKEILFGCDAVGTVDDFDNAKHSLRFILQREFIFPEQLPDLILLEISLPGEEGWKFLDGFSKLTQDLKEKIHLVILTSSEDPNVLRQAGDYPDVEEVIVKPLTKEKVWDLQKKIWEGLKK